MTIGIFAYDMTGTELLQLGVAADVLGFGGLWLGEHLMLAQDYASSHPTHGMSQSRRPSGPRVSGQTRLFDPLTMLAGVAAATRSIGLGTAVYLVPLRHPLLIAQTTASLADLSGGRFSLGVGSGWLREEFDALGVPFDGRGQRLDEALDIMECAWQGRMFDYHGSHFSFDPVQITLEPVHIPVVIGGNSPIALRRAAARGDGWISSGTPSIKDAVKLRDALVNMRGETSRRPLVTYFRLEDARPQTVEEFRSNGMADVILAADLVWGAGDLNEKLTRLRHTAQELGCCPPQVSAERLAQAVRDRVFSL